jgi:hypothetical protein
MMSGFIPDIIFVKGFRRNFLLEIGNIILSLRFTGTLVYSGNTHTSDTGHNRHHLYAPSVPHTEYETLLRLFEIYINLQVLDNNKLSKTDSHSGCGKKSKK